MKLRKKTKKSKHQHIFTIVKVGDERNYQEFSMCSCKELEYIKGFIDGACVMMIGRIDGEF